MSARGYRSDLAYIHDAGYSEYVLRAAPAIVRLLRRQRIREGLVVDLGCGSGRLARVLNDAGYDVLGIDQSPAMIRLAREIAPKSRFRVESLLQAVLPACAAITATGEGLNYCFDEGNSRRSLRGLFKRAHEALPPGGLFVFDVASPERFPQTVPQRHWNWGDDWAVEVSVTGDRKRHLLERKITIYRDIEGRSRKSTETHLVRLYRPADLEADLTKCGFRVRTMSRYGTYRLPPGIVAMVAVRRR